MEGSDICQRSVAMPMKDVVARVVGVSTVFLAFTNPINALSANESSFLSVEGTSLVYDGSQVFLSGANQPWVSYGQDFGNNQSNSIRCELDQCALNVSTAGGNSVRMWVFVEGKSIPEFDSNGNCVGTDATSTLVDDVREYARYAAQENVFLVLCLWNGAVASSDGAVAALVNDDDKLQTFIDNVRGRRRQCAPLLLVQLPFSCVQLCPISLGSHAIGDCTQRRTRYWCVGDHERARG